MAPEQIEGEPFTVRSDIYSLGLLLYELFTSQRAFEAPTLGELLRLRRSTSTPATPTSIVKDLDPVIEKVIDRCLQKDPASRPSSALQVAAALPGGDPIAAALAAGETPSPEMVAAAPQQGILRPAIAGALFVSFLALIALNCWLTKFTAIYRMTTLDKSPEVLRAHATDVIKQLGYADPAVDSASGVVLKNDYLNYISSHDQSPNRWQQMRNAGPGPYRFWYRQSPRYFKTMEDIEVDKPALDVSGMTSIYLDMSGRLHWFMGVPPQREPQTETQTAQPPTFDWSVPFREAGLDIANFQPVASTWIPLHAYDSRAAWDGSILPNRLTRSMWKPQRFVASQSILKRSTRGTIRCVRRSRLRVAAAKILVLMLIVIILVALVGSFVLARRNLYQGRGDRRGATRVALVFLASRMLVWLFVEPHSGLPEREFDVFFLYLATSMFSSTFLWLLYVALEPFVRKRWPLWIISWSRLLAGDYRNPLIGRDILIGGVIGAGMTLMQMLSQLAPRLIGQPSSLLVNPGSAVLSTHIFFYRFTTQLSAALFLAFIAIFILLLFVAVFRRERIALVLLWLLLTVMTSLISQSSWIMVPFVAISDFLLVFALKRYGLLALSAALFFTHLSVFYPITTELTAWYGIHFTIALVICLALAAYGFYISLGGQKLLSGTLLEE